MNVTFAFLGMGGMEMVIIFGAVLLLFGPKKLPELARGLGKGIREFKRASNEVTEELQRAVDEPPAPRRFPSESIEPQHSIPRSSEHSTESTLHQLPSESVDSHLRQPPH